MNGIANNTHFLEINGVYDPAPPAPPQFDPSFLEANGVILADAGPLLQSAADNLDPQEPKTPPIGEEIATLPGTDAIESYTGDFPSPLQVMWYVPEGNEVFRTHIPDTEIRGWIQDAADYHGIPQEMLAVILQQENGPEATGMQKFLQFGERSLTTFSAIVDDALFDIVPDGISRGSSGFANMSYYTLQDAATYTEEVYGRNPLSEDARYRVGGWDQDTRIPGDDYRADLYYASAHIRQLIDRVTGEENFHGALTMEQARQVFMGYNGSGPLAEGYASDAMELLNGAMNGTETLYFYER
jgi:hypothetical protein